jgi:branched-chain amino acid transport system permease protein
MRFPFGTFPLVMYRVAGLRVSLLQLTIVGCMVAAVAALLLYLHRTSFGRQVRAVAVNVRAAPLLGINPQSVYFQTFFISGALAAAAGVIVGVAFNSVYFLMGEPILLRAFVVIVLGGMGSVWGCIVAGWTLGIIQTMTVAFLSSELSDTVLFTLLVLILLVRPTGLFAGIRRDARVVRQ